MLPIVEILNIQGATIGLLSMVFSTILFVIVGWPDVPPGNMVCWTATMGFCTSLILGWTRKIQFDEEKITIRYVFLPFLDKEIEYLSIIEMNYKLGSKVPPSFIIKYKKTTRPVRKAAFFAAGRKRKETIISLMRSKGIDVSYY